MKKGQLGRADLLEALVREDQRVTLTLAESFGLTFQPEIKPVLAPWPAGGPPVKRTTVDTPLQRSPTATLTSWYWQPLQQKNLDDEKQPAQKQETTSRNVVWHNRPKTSPNYPALTTLEDLRHRLFPALNLRYHGRYSIDIPAVIDKISRAESVEELPKKKQQISLQALQIIDDRQLYLTPYWLDHVWLTRQLYDEYADYQISRAVLLHGDAQPLNIADNGDLLEYQLPPAGTPVLILSDLGRLSNNSGERITAFNRRQKQYWQLVGQLSANGNPVIVLTPCAPGDYPLEMRRQACFVAWESQSVPIQNLMQKQVATGEMEDSATSWVELLLILASPAIRLEPQLLRCLRLGMRQFGQSIPAAVEALLWQHSDVKEPHNIAATLSPQANKQYRKRFAELEPQLQKMALRILKQWRAGLPSEIWFEELLGIESLLELNSIFQGRELCAYHQDIGTGCNFLQQIIDHDTLHGDKGAAYSAWAARLEERIPESAVQKGKARRMLQTIIHQLEPDTIRSRNKHVIDPDLLGPTSHYKQTAWLCQYGTRLAVTPYTPTRVPGQNTSIITSLSYQHPVMKVVSPSGETASCQLPEQLSTDVVPLEKIEGFGENTLLTMRTDHTEITMQAATRPAWATGMGRDKYGLFADMQIAGERDDGALFIQRFRWIVAGEFMMGEPDNQMARFMMGLPDETPERNDDEDYHRVTLTRGYWLADTTVTQAVWKAVMGKMNPSSFAGEHNPVENVSWGDIVSFIDRLNKQFSSSLGELVIRLPTEAEWEHACRAGTDTPFSFGNTITPEQVNYNGNYPYADGKKGEYREKTVPVKSLPVNPWGLYEMHGNVWEWCADNWQENLGEEPVIDPFYEEQESYVEQLEQQTVRVLRGGSWFINGWGARSAYRNHYLPDFRNDIIGFRLALGHVSSSRGSERIGKG